MRSKEEKEAIKSLENFVNQKYYNGVTAAEMKIVLDYIGKLEYQIQENKMKEHFNGKDNLIG